MALFAMNSSETKETQDNPLPDPPAAEPSLADQLAAAKKEAADNHDRYLRTAPTWRTSGAAPCARRRSCASSPPRASWRTCCRRSTTSPSASPRPAAQRRPEDPGRRGRAGAAAAQGGARRPRPEGDQPRGQPFDPHQHEAISHQPSADLPRGARPHGGAHRLRPQRPPAAARLGRGLQRPRPRRRRVDHGQGGLLRTARRRKGRDRRGAEEGLSQEGGPVPSGQEPRQQGGGGDVQEGLRGLRGR
jgi:molecular chaperone GrpE